MSDRFRTGGAGGEYRSGAPRAQGRRFRRSRRLAGRPLLAPLAPAPIRFVGGGNICAPACSYLPTRDTKGAALHHQRALKIIGRASNPVYLGNVARAQLRQGTSLEEVRGLLKEMIFYDTRPEWIAWARDTMGVNPVQMASAEGFDAGRNETNLPTAPEPTPPPNPPEPLPARPSSGPPLAFPLSVETTDNSLSLELFP